MKEYQINIRDAKSRIVNGKHAFTMFGYKFFIYSSVDNPGTGNYFTHRNRVCEVSTGFHVADMHYKKDAIEKAKFIIEKNGKDIVDAKIWMFLEKNPLTGKI